VEREEDPRERRAKKLKNPPQAVPTPLIGERSGSQRVQESFKSTKSMGTERGRGGLWGTRSEKKKIVLFPEKEPRCKVEKNGRPGGDDAAYYDGMFTGLNFE